MTISAEEAKAVFNSANRLFSQEEMETAMDRMAAEITAELAESDPIVLSVMNGGLIPAGQILTRLDFPLRVDYVHATRYRGETSGSELHWLRPPEELLEGKVVLILDDILDEGVTLAAIVESCRNQGAVSVHTAVLVEKDHERSNGFQADFVGVKAADCYLFGYGMDYKGYLRNAAGIYAVASSA
ncbi:Hypoxanthine-guanine phosphoribosyltransferase [hydrothermal vent metagenome]|uniref:Hypoxanthine-guanine phosphoribosyltransferase n=1 Tax=hydrothermal vent metagenome TaxID=652676 RepID=A0A3B1B6W8_9ZZZZ